MNKEFFVKNRSRFAEQLEEGSVAILHSGLAPVKSNDQDMSPFAVNRNFYYLTGIDTENVWLVLSKSAAGVDEMLFIDQPDDFLIKWNGWMLTCAPTPTAPSLPSSATWVRTTTSTSTARTTPLRRSPL